MGWQGQGLVWGLLLAASGLPLQTTQALQVVLEYEDGNKWVAPEKNAPLVKLLKEAAQGQTRYTVIAPATNRPLSIERMEIVQDRLAKEAKRPVVFIEIGGTTPANTLKIGTE